MPIELPAHTLNCENGWLAPDGRLIPNPGFAHHNRMAEKICAALGVQTDDAHKYLVNAGWGYLRQVGEWHIHRNAGSWDNDPDRLTAKQRNTIFDWCMAKDRDLPAFMRPQTELEPA